MRGARIEIVGRGKGTASPFAPNSKGLHSLGTSGCMTAAFLYLWICADRPCNGSLHDTSKTLLLGCCQSLKLCASLKKSSASLCVLKFTNAKPMHDILIRSDGRCTKSYFVAYPK